MGKIKKFLGKNDRSVICIFDDLCLKVNLVSAFGENKINVYWYWFSGLVLGYIVMIKN